MWDTEKSLGAKLCLTKNSVKVPLLYVDILHTKICENKIYIFGNAKKTVGKLCRNFTFGLFPISNIST